MYYLAKISDEDLRAAVEAAEWKHDRLVVFRDCYRSYIHCEFRPDWSWNPMDEDMPDPDPAEWPYAWRYNIYIATDEYDAVPDVTEDTPEEQVRAKAREIFLDRLRQERMRHLEEHAKRGARQQSLH